MTAGRGLRDALGSVSLKALSLGLERICRLVVVIASAPLLGQAAFGRFVFASTVTTLLALGTDLGLGVWTTRALARDPGGGAAVVRVGLALRGLAALPYTLAIAGVAWLGVRGETRGAIALLGVAALVNAFVDHFSAILRGYERFRDEAGLNASRAVLTALFGFAALRVGRSLGGLCAALTLASLGSCIYGIAILFRSGPPERAASRGMNRLLARSALRQSLPIWIAGFLSLLYFKVDTLFLRAFAGDAELGAYGAAYKFFEGAMIVPAVLLAVAFPRLSRAHRDPAVQRRIEWQLGVLLFALGFAAGAVCFFGGSALVKLTFGVDFRRAVASLDVLAFGLPLLFLNFGLTHFLLARDMGRATSLLSLAMLALNVVLNLSLVPQRSGPGAAWATVLTEVALTLGCLGALRESAAPRSAQAEARTEQKAA